MPELPEVEIARRQLEVWVGRGTIAALECRDPRISSAAGALSAWRGARTHALERHGKTILWTLAAQDAGAVVHLGMTGSIVRLERGEEPPRHARLIWRLRDGSGAALDDPRRFGRVIFGPTSELRRHPLYAREAPDPLDAEFTTDAFAAILAGTRSPVKVALMDQARIAGIGNIYAAEACFRARIHPSRPASRLDPPELRRLFAAVQSVLRHGLRGLESAFDGITYVNQGGRNPFRVYGRDGRPCPRCRTPIQSFPQGGRTTWFCPVCQPRQSPRRGRAVRTSRHGTQR